MAGSVVAAGNADSISAIPDALPKVGGPVIMSAYALSASTIIVTIQHKFRDGLRVPLQATLGTGFSVMDGGSITAPGAIVNAISCQRLDATHLQIGLSQALRNSPALCTLYYPYGPGQIGRGNAVTDNFSAIPMPAGWDASSDLGPTGLLTSPCRRPLRASRCRCQIVEDCIKGYSARSAEFTGNPHPPGRLSGLPSRTSMSDQATHVPRTSPPGRAPVASPSR